MPSDQTVLCLVNFGNIIDRKLDCVTPKVFSQGLPFSL